MTTTETMRAPVDFALPEPSSDALAHSAACAAMLREDIAQHGGWVSFAHFMERVLYAPGLGYYAAGARKFGPDGDFVTAPELSSLFGQCIAQCAADVLRQTRGDILELGPGSGKLCGDMLTELDVLGALPNRYCVLEVSADLRERQREAINRLPGHLAARVEWLDRLPAAFSGLIVANEVLDVVPLNLVVQRDGAWFERGVGVADGAFAWSDRPLRDGVVEAHAETIATRLFQGSVPDGYVLEIAPQVAALTTSLANALQRGALLFIDYGFRAAEYYHPERHMGTLMCHYRHRAHGDPFLYPGLQDITAHVDFTAVADAAVGAGLQLEGYATQAQFLLGAGLADRLLSARLADAAETPKLNNDAQRLVSPAEMGELFKAIAFSKGIRALSTFARARPLPL
jgi:SAM-dependent MidA family methyltransferase